MNENVQQQIFRLLSDEELNALTTVERVEYLRQAMNVHAQIERQVRDYLARRDLGK